MMLITRIAQARDLFEQANCEKPTKLFVGKLEWMLLRELAREIDFKMLPGSQHAARPEYRGLKIYEVDDSTYLEVGK